MRGWCKQEQDHAVIAAAHSLQELHHLNLGAAAGAHDFFSAGQAAAMHGLGSIDNASLEHSTGSNSVVYNGVGDSNGSTVVGGGGYMMPMSAAAAATTAMVSHEQVHARAQGDHDEAKQAAQMGYESYLVNAENYGGGRMSAAWATVSAPPVAAAASSNDNMAGVGHGGAQLFSVWNDT
jgi:AP2-like factor (ANT lineage)